MSDESSKLGLQICCMNAVICLIYTDVDNPRVTNHLQSRQSVGERKQTETVDFMFVLGV